MSRVVEREAPPHFAPHPGDPTSFPSTATITLVPNSAVGGSPALGDITIRQGDGTLNLPALGPGMTPDLSQLPHSSFAPSMGRKEPQEATPLAPAPGPPSNGSTMDASSRTPFTEDPAVKETWKLAYHKYVEEQFPMGHYSDGRVELEDLNKSGVTVRLLTLRPRVDVVRRVRFVAETVQYEDYAKRQRPSLRDDLVALLENVANSLQVVLDLCYALPWPELAPQAPPDWVMLCIPEAGETYYSVAELGRAYRYAHDWIDSAASSVECMLILRPAGQFVRPPKKSSSAIGRFALMGATPRADSSDSSRTGSPIPGATREDVEARHVTIKTPPPIFRTPGHAAQALVTAEMRAAPRTPVQGIDERIHEQYGGMSHFLQSTQRTLRDAVIDSNETMPVHADGFSAVAPASQSFVSQQLPAVLPSAMSNQHGIVTELA